VLDQGRVVEEGSHQELLARGEGGRYAELWEMQQKHHAVRGGGEEEEAEEEEEEEEARRLKRKAAYDVRLRGNDGRKI